MNNTSQFMDKKIMNSQANYDFLDLATHRLPVHHDAKKEDILSNYDFQPIRSIGLSSSPPQHNNYHKIQNDGSLDTVERVKVISEKDRSIYDAALLSEIDRTMKKHTDDLLHALAGVSARLSQLETRSHHLENSIDDLKDSIGNNYGSTDGKMRQIENILREVQDGVQVVKDKQEISKQSEQPQTAGHMDAVQQVASAPMQSYHQLPPATHTQTPPQPNFPPPNAPPPQNLPPPPPSQFPQTQIPPMPQHDPYYLPPGQTQPNQQYQLPPQQLLPPPPSQPQPQQPPQYQQPPPPPPQYSQSHHSEEPSYMPSQSYPPNFHQSGGGPPPSQQFYGPPLMTYEPPPPSSRPSSGFAHGPSTGHNEPFPYSGPQHQYNMGSPRKSHQSSSNIGASGGNGYSHLPTARILPQALPTASAVGGGSGGGGSSSGGSGNRVPVDDVVDKVSSMGFSREQVRAAVRKLTENGKSVDLNTVLDKLMNGH